MTKEMLSALIGSYSSAITCFCFMGGDAEPMEVMRLARWIRNTWPGIRIAWYSGKSELPDGFDITVLDYLKLGPYVSELGGLKSPETNQVLYRILPDGNRTRISL